MLFDPTFTAIDTAEHVLRLLAHICPRLTYARLKTALTQDTCANTIKVSWTGTH